MKEKFIKVTPKKQKMSLTKTKALIRSQQMTDAEIEAAAADDSDNLPLTKTQLARFRPVKQVPAINVRKIREDLGMSQSSFARYFGVSVRTLQEWEQHRHNPNRTARNFLLVIAKEPQAVQRALT
jgi:putative transcriptional regulator